MAQVRMSETMFLYSNAIFRSVQDAAFMQSLVSFARKFAHFIL
jgi:hypothetical protein